MSEDTLVWGERKKIRKYNLKAGRPMPMVEMRYSKTWEFDDGFPITLDYGFINKNHRLPLRVRLERGLPNYDKQQREYIREYIVKKLPLDLPALMRLVFSYLKGNANLETARIFITDMIRVVAGYPECGSTDPDIIVDAVASLSIESYI